MTYIRAFTTLSDVATRPVWKVKQTYYHKLWHALTAHRWHEFERLLSEMRLRNIHLDEVTYTLKAHYCILNPHKPSMNCYLVLEEMKQALAHPAVIRMNENLINSYFELEELKCQPPFALWQNFTKLIWQTSFRLNRQRMRNLKQSLLNMDPNDVMQLNDEDVAALAQDEFLHAMFSSTLTIDEIYDEPIAICDPGSTESQLSQEHQMHAEASALERPADTALEEGVEIDHTTEASESSSEECLDYEYGENEDDIEYEYVYEKRGGYREHSTTVSSDSF